MSPATSYRARIRPGTLPGQLGTPAPGGTYPPPINPEEHPMEALLDRETELRSFMTMATHDLKSPLAAASAHLEMLREDHAATLGEQGERDLDGIERGLRRMERLVEDLLD